ncbi:ABC transporter substrate-binding protein [Neotabrizicola shimadae]|uniref:ABC transporter substrate-binding protein n=1 Tax=Neotabrizicola shimadae TaxID=2807096 RepID=A0A8G0ZT19_9RHOB|nr:ABC transporter substrate-binding protein [Neotabrizicola shimadae]QYZ69588.1 ABC transporter substrate-binding protein [Neotabrizicola shimadae]
MLTRRRLLTTAAATGLAAVSVHLPRPAFAAGRAIRIGLVTPASGPLAPFAAADSFVLDQLKDILAAGVQIAGETHPIEVIVKDSQSNPSRAAEVAAELIDGDEVDLIIAAGTADTTNPTADQAEAAGVPCITTDTPWQAHFFGRRGEPETGFDWTYHFFWGLGQISDVYVGIWNLKDTNRKIGALWSNDPDGVAIQGGVTEAVTKDGKFTLVDAGLFAPGSTDFSAQIAQFKEAGVEILTGLMIPPDFSTFWTQAAQQGFQPKIATVAKALLFPQTIDALGDRGTGLTTELWWSPFHPFTSSLTGQSAADLCAAFEAATGTQWTPPLGFKHALMEVAIDALRRSAALEPEAIRDAIKATNLATIAGPVNFSAGPVPNISETPLVGGQWIKGTAFPHDQSVIFNATAPEIPVNAELQLL